MKRDAIVRIIVMVAANAAAFGQSAGQGNPAVPPRVTPLGTQRPKTGLLNSPGQARPANQEQPAAVIDRAVNAHGGRRALDSIRDSIAEGRLTFFTGKTPKNTVDVTVIRKGDAQIQRILREGNGESRQGSDGTTAWDSFNGMTAPATAGLVRRYIESQTVRAVGSLFDSPPRGHLVRDGGLKNNARVLEIEIVAGGSLPFSTRYSVDEATSLVTRIEFVTGEAKDLFGQTIPTTESYLFSDFRSVQGVSTPFRIERYVDGLKIEETRFTSVRYNVSVPDDVFKP